MYKSPEKTRRRPYKTGFHLGELLILDLLWWFIAVAVLVVLQLFLIALLSFIVLLHQNYD